MKDFLIAALIVCLVVFWLLLIPILGEWLTKVYLPWVEGLF